MTVGFVLNIVLFAFIIWRFSHLFKIISAQTHITLVDKYLRWPVISILIITLITILLGFIQKYFGIEVNPLAFFIRSFKHIESVNMFFIPILTIILAILSGFNINRKIIFPTIMVLAFFLILFFVAALLSLEYVTITDVLYDTTALWTYRLITIELFIYSGLMVITSIAVIYPEFEDFFNESKTKDLKIIAISLFIISVSFIPSFKVLEKIVHRYDIKPIIKTTTDIDAIEILDYFAEIEKEMAITEEEAISFLDDLIKDEDIGVFEKLNKIEEASYEIDLSITNCILYNDENCVLELLNDFFDKSQHSKSELIYNFEILDMFLFKADYLNNQPIIQKLIINKLFNDLIKLKINDPKDKYYKIVMLKNHIHYSINYNLESLTPRLIDDFNQYILKSMMDNPYMRLYGLTQLASLYTNLGQHHKAEKTLLRLMDDFNNSKHLADNNIINKRYFADVSQQIPMIFATSILRQRESSELALKLFRDFMAKDTGDQKNPFSYLAKRNYYEVTMQSLGYLLYSYPEKGNEIKNDILALIEKNKSREFLNYKNANWIKQVPVMKNNQAGFNYITSNYITLGQYYDADTTISFILERPNPESLKLSGLWNISYVGLLDKNGSEEIKNDLKIQLIDLVVPKMIQNKIQNKDLIISADGILQQIPFQWLLSELSVNSIKYIPGFSFMDSAPEKENSSILAIAVPSPDISNDIELEGSISEIYRGQVAGDSLIFAVEEVNEISKMAKNYNLNTKVKINPTETWVRDEINQYDIIHFATHSVSSSAYGVGSTGVMLIKDDKNDGFLSEEEIAELNLNGQMVYLSSCESGLGEYIVGEGLLSIARAFLSAGASGVVSTLWSVNDKSAKDISVKYYSNYFQSQSPENALFNAQKDYYQSDLWKKYPFTYTSY